MTKCAREQRDDDGRVLAPLRLVDGAGVGERQVVEIATPRTGDLPARRNGRPCVALFRIDARDEANVAVEDVPVVVVAELHHLVADADRCGAPRTSGVAARVQRRLERLVERDGARGRRGSWA